METSCLSGIMASFANMNSASTDFPYRSIAILRGLSASDILRNYVVKNYSIAPLLDLVHASDEKLRNEAILCICNLSLSGCIGDNPDLFLSKIGIGELFEYLKSQESAKRLLGIIALGNIATSPELHKFIVLDDGITILVHLSSVADDETLRCIAL